MTLDVAFSLGINSLTFVLIALMVYKRVFRHLPVFFAYLCFDLVSSAFGLAIYSRVSAGYARFFLFECAVDCLLYFCVLAELGRNLLRANRKSGPHWSLAILLFAGAVVLTAVLARWAAVPSRSVLGNMCFLGMRADGVLQFAGFLALISWSSLRKFHWPEPELRIANGFGLITFVWFLVTLLQFQWNTSPVYYWLYDAMQAACLIILAYWLHYFWMVDAGSPARNEVAEPYSRHARDNSEPTHCVDLA